MRGKQRQRENGRDGEKEGKSEKEGVMEVGRAGTEPAHSRLLLSLPHDPHP